MADKAKTEGGLLQSLSVIIQALLIAVVIRTVLFQSVNIPSESMKSTLLVGDYLFVNKFAYGYANVSIPFAPNLINGRIFARTPERGDIIVFRGPKGDGVDYIKRLIGLPGDKVQMIGGVLFLNGQAVPRERMPDYLDERSGRPIVRYRETLPNGVSYATLDLGRTDGDDTTLFTVPAGHYFMMGDNRDNSADSRFPAHSMGSIPFDHLIGRAEIIYFSQKEDAAFWQFWTWPVSIRWNRLLGWVQDGGAAR